VGLFEDHAGRFWIFSQTGSGLALFDPKSNTITPYSFYQKSPGTLDTSGIGGIVEDADGQLWLASSGIGLVKLNRERTRFYHYANEPDDPNSISENNVVSITKDHDGNIWTGLHSTGVNYFGKNYQRFEVFRHVPSDPQSLTINFVNAIIDDDRGALWIGNNDGLNRIDRKSRRRTVVDLGIGRQPDIISLVKDRNGIIWIGTFAHGLIRYAPKSGRIERFSHDPSIRKWNCWMTQR
jgi:ligand-binding sensor domain-containing protein